MRRLGKKTITPVYGDYKPVTRRINNKRAAGWRLEERTGTEAAWSGTYNDNFILAMVKGKSSQSRTVLGKNLLNMHSAKIYDEIGFKSQADGTSQQVYRDYDIIYGTSRNGYIYREQFQYINLDPSTNTVSMIVGSGYAYYGVGFKIRAAQNESFAFSPPQSKAMIGWSFHDSSGEIITFGTAETASAPADTAFLWVIVMTAADSEMCTFVNAQAEHGTVQTEYEPYVPNSPAPDTPSQIVSAGDGEGISIAVAGGAGQTQSFSRGLALRSLPDGTSDTWDAAAGELTRRVGAYEFDGSAVSFYGPVQENDESGCFYTDYFDGMIYNSPEEEQSAAGLCTHAPVTDLCTAQSAGTVYDCVSVTGAVNNKVRFRIKKEHLSEFTADGFSAWLADRYAAGKPVTIQYKLANPSLTGVSLSGFKTFPRYTMLRCSAEFEASARVADNTN